MMNLTHVAPWLSKQGVWGPVTATLDWCEINHQFSPYVAEMANTFSNLFTISLSLGGCMDAINEGLPNRYALGYLGVALVGVGSFFFHATLLFEAQLADELPMIYVGSLCLFMLFDTKGGFGLQTLRTKGLIALLILFDALFTWSYMVYRNPVYHQAVFASIVISTAARVAYILNSTEAGKGIPPKTKAVITNFFSTGFGLFAFGFFVWNLDNLFCHKLTEWKLSIGWPAAFLLEGHSWWHVLTGLGTYYMFIGVQYATVCVKESHRDYVVKHDYGIPYLRRSHLKVH
ncbi:ceramidase [Crepidotus variabilis]|uniref:Ceramidase n=1 Tax=Crepidotus variabilis TaxID=179855 RepID=A0A9P6EN04_9AGAR|nr:ceramidase [Crepidotus variabilis]